MYPPHWCKSKTRVTNIATLFADIKQNGRNWLQNGFIQSLDLGQHRQENHDLNEEEIEILGLHLREKQVDSFSAITVQNNQSNIEKCSHKSGDKYKNG
jgi:hypothetical protein